MSELAGHLKRKGRPLRVPLLVSLVALSVAVPVAVAATSPKIKRVSVSSSGTQGNGGSREDSISGNGRFVAFTSDATNFGCALTGIVVRDMKAHKTRCASLSSSGAQGDGISFDPSISANGQFVAFTSEAHNFSAACSASADTIFVRDLKTHKTQCVSVSSTGAQANNGSETGVISADGRFVAFNSFGTNLGGCTNGLGQIFVRDLKTHKTRCVSVSSAGKQGNGLSDEPSISANGQFIAFHTVATNLGCANGVEQIVVRDLKTNKTRCVSRSSSGAQGNGNSEFPSISADGRFVAFDTDASNLGCVNHFQIIVTDLKTNKTSCVSRSSSGAPGNDDSFSPSISATGRFIAFESLSTNLGCVLPGIRQIIVTDLKTHKTSCVSRSSVGDGNADSFTASMSANGRFVSFASDASDLVNGDTNSFEDIFRAGPLG